MLINMRMRRASGGNNVLSLGEILRWNHELLDSPVLQPFTRPRSFKALQNNIMCRKNYKRMCVIQNLRSQKVNCAQPPLASGMGQVLVYLARTLSCDRDDINALNFVHACWTSSGLVRRIAQVERHKSDSICNGLIKQPPFFQDVDILSRNI